jgi:hypothetical protein
MQEVSNCNSYKVELLYSYFDVHTKLMMAINDQNM